MGAPMPNGESLLDGPRKRAIPARELACRALLRRALLAAALGAPLCGAAPTAPTPGLALSPCLLPGLAREARCGRFAVFEDRAARKGRTIALRVAVLPATGPDRQPDPIFYFAGGPGASAVDAAAELATEWEPALRRRDLVLVDVRGTGDSNGLACTALRGRAGVIGFLDDFLPAVGVRACRKELQAHADLALYTTTNAVDDLDDARAALGYGRIDLRAGSYGSLLALVYLRRHGEHVRTATLDGVVPPDSRSPLHFAADAQHALDQVLDACAADARCHAAFPDPRAELARVLERLERTPARVEIRDATSGEAVPVELGGDAVAQSLRYMLYLPESAARIPLDLHLADRGDLEPLAEAAVRFGDLMGGIAQGFFLSVTCAEDVPFYEVGEADAEARGSFLGDFRARAQKAACAEWPRGRVPAGFAEPVRSSVPTLLLSGERDPVTPAQGAEEVARTLPHALRVVARGGGHSLDGLGGADCLGRLFTDFLDRGQVEGLDTRCVSRIEPAPFVLADDRVAALTLSPQELDRFPAAYAGKDGNELRIRRHGDVLQLVFGDGSAFALTPVSPTRFAIAGAPPGFFVEFELAAGRVTGMVLEQGAHDRQELRRR